jgi:transcriptional accessory protein Tex/SPT6
VDVQVLSVDLKKQRIQLTMKIGGGEKKPESSGAGLHHRKRIKHPISRSLRGLKSPGTMDQKTGKEITFLTIL